MCFEDVAASSMCRVPIFIYGFWGLVNLSVHGYFDCLQHMFADVCFRVRRVSFCTTWFIAYSLWYQHHAIVAFGHLLACVSCLHNSADCKLFRFMLKHPLGMLQQIALWSSICVSYICLVTLFCGMPDSLYR